MDVKLELLEAPRVSRFVKDTFDMTYKYFEGLNESTNQFLNPEWQETLKRIKQASEKKENNN